MLYDIKAKRGEGVLTLGWDSFKYYFIRSDVKRERDLYTYGFNSVNIDVITSDFLKEKNIKYFIHDKIGSDYYNTADKLLQKLDSTSGVLIFKNADVWNQDALSHADMYFARVYFLDY